MCICPSIILLFSIVSSVLFSTNKLVSTVSRTYGLHSISYYQTTWLEYKGVQILLLLLSNYLAGIQGCTKNKKEWATCTKRSHDPNPLISNSSELHITQNY